MRLESTLFQISRLTFSVNSPQEQKSSFKNTSPNISPTRSQPMPTQSNPLRNAEAKFKSFHPDYAPNRPFGLVLGA